MKKEDLVAMGLTEEQADKILGLHTEELKGFIPKSRFDDVNDTKKDLEQQIRDRDKQLKDLGEKVKGNEEAEKTIKELQETNKKTKGEYESKIKEMKINAAIMSELSDAKYPELLVREFDRAKLSIADDGTVSGIKDEGTRIREVYKDQFTPVVQGREPYNKTTTTSTSITKEQFNRMSYKEKVELYNTNKELYDTLTTN